jgi:hypothetical protein
MSRLDAVQMKVGLTGMPARHAALRLGLRLDGVDYSVYFCERLTAAPGPAPLYAQGVILRLRHSGRGRGASTVKLRPLRRTRLRPQWSDLVERDGHRLRIEADWSADRVLAASLVTVLPAARLEAVLAGHSPARDAFSSLQQAFLAECTDLAAVLDGLVVLGPVLVRRCDPVRWYGYDVAAEWWGLPGMDDELELSLHTGVAGAEVIRRGFDSRLRQHGIEEHTAHRKTTIVIERLAAQWRDAAQ